MSDPVVAVLACLVIGISDGDTLTARCRTDDGHQNLKIRLAEIDAPELRQAFGQRSRQHLAGLCFRKSATAARRAVDRYGRAAARVSCAGVDAKQVRSGMAWAFLRYVKDPAIVALEAVARRDQQGLWRDPDPMAPWDWRAMRRNLKESP